MLVACLLKLSLSASSVSRSLKYFVLFVFILLFSQPIKLCSSHIPDINHSPPEVLTKENPFHTCFLDAIDQISPESCLIFKSNQKSICVRCGRCGRRNCWPGMFTFLTLSNSHYMGHLISHPSHWLSFLSSIFFTLILSQISFKLKHSICGNSRQSARPHWMQTNKW